MKKKDNFPNVPEEGDQVIQFVLHYMDELGSCQCNPQ